jgi:hypothetical protein
LRFAANGLNIPDELLVARDEGRVVFFCGAGVSRAKAHLKDFIGLARSVADKLSISADKPACQLINAIETFPPISGVGSLISADRVFGLIERDFLSRDIYRAIAESLKPEGTPDLTAHRLLLDLARGPDGTIRLITTNFDLLFEDCDSTIPVSRHLAEADSHQDAASLGEAYRTSLVPKRRSLSSVCGLRLAFGSAYRSGPYQSSPS